MKVVEAIIDGIMRIHVYSEVVVGKEQKRLDFGSDPSEIEILIL